MTTDLESRLSQTLQGRAAEAMDATDTSAELQELEGRLAHQHTPARPRRAVVGAAAALTAAAVVLGVAWFAGTGSDADRGPVDDRMIQDPAERLTQEFVEAFADGDNARVATMLADKSDSPPAWRDYAKLARAWSIEYLLSPCQTIRESDFETEVGCTFDVHVLHSEELGLGPYGDNLMSVTVRDGKIHWFNVVYNTQLSGATELYDSVASWIRENHPEDWEFLDSGWAFVQRAALPQSDVPRWVWLWQRYSAQYADETTQTR